MGNNKKIMTHEILFKEIQKYIEDQASIAIIEKAYQYAKNKHEGQFRKSGEAYFVHLQNVAYILATLKVGPQTICAGLLHDTIEDCEVTKEELINEFDEEIANLVEAVTKIGNLKFKDQKEYQAANHRKIFIAMAKDVRVIIIKLVDRLHNMRTLEYMRPDKQQRIAQETLDVYAPIAHRLGISNIKNELEDLCFYYLHQDEYYRIAKLVEAKKAERDKQVVSMIENISKMLTDKHIKFRIFGRSKHLYSIYKKMVQKNKRFEEILDLLALRIVTETELNCYEILGYIHATYRPIPGRLKDYIAMPKMNMYQSLHTTIVGEDGRIFEVQIRTEEMDSTAERGIAAHWRYKEGTNYNPRKEQKEIEAKLSWFKDLENLTEDVDKNNPKEYMDTLTRDVFEANIYVMTPNGRVIDLPNGSNPIDFAYRVHTEVGNTTVGALVNETLVPLNTVLKTGDVVEIKTNKSSSPSADWLNIVKTNNARNKIRNYLSKVEIERKSEFVKVGEQIVKDELKKRGFEVEEYFTHKNIEALFSHFQVNNYIEFMYAVAQKSISPVNVVEKLTGQHGKTIDSSMLEKMINEREVKKLPSKNGVSVVGIDSMMVSLANCCKPVYGEAIVGYITKGSGVRVHRVDCPNIKKETSRLIDVNWDPVRPKTKYVAYVNVLCSDRNFLLTDIVTVISQCKSSLKEVNSVLNQETFIVKIRLAVLVDDINHLNNIMINLRKLSNVIEVERMIR